jgi:hypothetical protein
MTHQLPINLQISKPKERLDVRILKTNETETFAPARLTIQHDSTINNLAKLGEKLPHRFTGDGGGETTNEELCRSLVLLPWDSTLRVNLHRENTAIINDKNGTQAIDDACKTGYLLTTLPSNTCS